MPTWTPNWDDVDFDHDAAATAVAACRQTAAKLVSAQNEALPPAVTTARVDWTGALAAEFDEVTAIVLPDMGAVAVDLRSLATAIESAAAAATREQATREADRDRWRTERAAEEAAEDCRLPSGRPVPC